MPKASREPAEILVVGVASPLLAGVYVQGRLKERFESDKKSSEALPRFLADALSRYEPTALYYARGPGSFMAVKVSYVTLKTLAIALDIPLYGCDAFAFNGNAPIKAVGRSAFVKEGGKIVIKPHMEATGRFALPTDLKREDFIRDAEPLYVLPAV